MAGLFLVKLREESSCLKTYAEVSLGVSTFTLSCLLMIRIRCSARFTIGTGYLGLSACGYSQVLIPFKGKEGVVYVELLV